MLALASPALVQIPPPPMNFRAARWCDDSNMLLTPNPNRPLSACPAHFVRYAIFANGVILNETPAAFERFLKEPRHGRLGPGTDLYLNSGGGIVDAGLALGRMVRSEQFSTWVGTQATGAGLHSKPIAVPGFCASSCTLVFLGGVERYFSAGVFGLHRIYWNVSEVIPGFHICRTWHNWKPRRS